MRRYSFLALLVATMAATVAAAWTVAQRDTDVAPASVQRPAFPGLAAHLGDLAWMRLAHGPSVVDFAVIDGAWSVVEKGNYPAAPERMRRLLRGLVALTLIAPKTRRQALFNRLGLDDPPRGAATLVSLQDRTGETVAALAVGRAHEDPVDGAGEVYVRRPGDDQTWLAHGALDLTGDAADWLDRRILDIARSRVASVTLTGGDGIRLTLRRAAPHEAFSLADPAAASGVTFKDDRALAAIAEAPAQLALDDVKPAADLVFPAAGVATAAFITFDGLRLDFRLYRAGERDWAAIRATGAGLAAGSAAATLNARLARWVYAIPADRARLLRTRLADLLLAPAKGS